MAKVWHMVYAGLLVLLSVWRDEPPKAKDCRQASVAFTSARHCVIWLIPALGNFDYSTENFIYLNLLGGKVFEDWMIAVIMGLLLALVAAIIALVKIIKGRNNVRSEFVQRKSRVT